MAVFGIVASLMILASYVPMSLVHSAQAKRIAKEALIVGSHSSEKDGVEERLTWKAIEEFLDSHHLSSSKDWRNTPVGETKVYCPRLNNCDQFPLTCRMRSINGQ